LCGIKKVCGSIEPLRSFWTKPRRIGGNSRITDLPFVAGFVWPETRDHQPVMFNDILAWLSFAITVASFILALTKSISPRRRCRRERYRSFKWSGIEWTTHEREDDSRS